MKMLSWIFFILVSLTFSFLAFAQQVASTFPVPEGDITALIVKFATDYKTMGVLGIITLLVLLSVQLVKKFVSDDWKFKRLLVLGMSIIWSILSGLVLPGANVLSVIITVFITLGGAMAIYDVLIGSGIIKKKVK